VFDQKEFGLVHRKALEPFPLRGARLDGIRSTKSPGKSRAERRENDPDKAGQEQISRKAQ
jgi:hypothetical protein